MWFLFVVEAPSKLCVFVGVCVGVSLGSSNLHPLISCYNSQCFFFVTSPILFFLPIFVMCWWSLITAIHLEKSYDVTAIDTHFSVVHLSPP